MKFLEKVNGYGNFEKEISLLNQVGKSLINYYI